MIRRILIVAGAAVLIAGLTYAASVELLASMNRANSAVRPEVENWIMPYVGMTAPPLVTAVGVFLLAVAVGTVTIALREGRQPHD